jgi:hypothetical protein
VPESIKKCPFSIFAAITSEMFRVVVTAFCELPDGLTGIVAVDIAIRWMRNDILVHNGEINGT